MSDIFISYSSEQRPQAELLAEALKGEGLSVFWDRDHTLGQLFDSYILDQLEVSRCVVVLWSPSSVESEWVQEEAQRGLRRGILVSAVVDDATPPLGSGRAEAIDLSGWNGDRAAPAYKKLVSEIQEKLRAEEKPDSSYSRTIATMSRSMRTVESEFLAPPRKSGRFAALITVMVAAALFLLIDTLRNPSGLDADEPPTAAQGAAVEDRSVEDRVVKDRVVKDSAEPAPVASTEPEETAEASPPSPSVAVAQRPATRAASPPPAFLTDANAELEDSFYRAFFRLQPTSLLTQEDIETENLVRRLTATGVRPEIQRLRILQQHLSLSLSKADPESRRRLNARGASWVESRRTHLEALEATVQQLWGAKEPWLPLLCAAREHSIEDFAAAAACLSDEAGSAASPRAATIRFFEGLNLFESARRSLAEGRWSAYRRNLERASSSSAAALDLARELTGDPLAAIAEPSALMLVGRVAMYTGDRQLSSSCFDELAEGPYLAYYRVAGLHGRGLLSLQRGNLSVARTWLQRAARESTRHRLGFEPHASLALVYLLDDRAELRESAYRLLLAIQQAGGDALSEPLTSAGLAHFLELADETSQAIIVDGYRRALRAVGHRPTSDDLATLQYLTGKQIYAGRDYYGRELLSLVLFARTLQAPPSQQADTPEAVLSDAAESFELYRRIATTQAFRRLPASGFGSQRTPPRSASTTGEAVSRPGG